MERLIAMRLGELGEVWEEPQERLTFLNSRSGLNTHFTSTVSARHLYADHRWPDESSMERVSFCEFSQHRFISNVF